jgi:hypothetical protein
MNERKLEAYLWDKFDVLLFRDVVPEAVMQLRGLRSHE